MQTLAKLKDSVAQILKDVKSIRGRIQTVGKHASGHALLDGNVETFNLLWTAMRGCNRPQFKSWAETYCFVKLTKDEKFIINKKARRDYAMSIDKVLVKGQENSLTAADCDEYIKTIAIEWWIDEKKEKPSQKALIIADTINRVAQGIYDAIENGRDITHESDPVTQAQANLVQAIKLATASSPTEQDGAQYKPHPIVGNSQVALALAAE